jgi:hypothetical protein
MSVYSLSVSKLLAKTKKPPDKEDFWFYYFTTFGFKYWRRGWDSNPRLLAQRRFSRPLPSSTRSPLHERGVCKVYFMLASYSVVIPAGNTSLSSLIATSRILCIICEYVPIVKTTGTLPVSHQQPPLPGRKLYGSSLLPVLQSPEVK